MIDYHVHTPLCNHASGTMDQYVKQAISCGLREICFLDHLTLNPAGRQQSMQPSEVGLYFQSVCRLREKYRGTISVKAGLEIDFNPHYIDLIENVINTYAFDVIGSSVHFLNDHNVVSRRTAGSLDRQSADRLFADYYAAVSEMLDFQYYDVICHLDVIKKFGRSPSCSLDREVDDLLNKISKKGLTVEINTSGYDHPVKEAYPARNILEACLAKSIPVTLASDAHKPQETGRYFSKALTMLKKIGYQQISAFSNRQRYTINLE